MTMPILSSGNNNSGRFNARELAEIGAGMYRAVKELERVEKNNPSGLVATNDPLYGPYADGSGDYGIFSQPGIRPTIFSAFQRPRSLASILGVRMSMNTNEKIGIMTGVTAGAGSNPTGFCGTAPTAGQLKLCKQNYIWGKSYWKASVVNVAEAGEYVDYADTEKRLLNLPALANPLLPDFMTRLDLQDRNSSLLFNELFTLGVEQERSLERVIVQGNETTVNTSTQRGWIQEFKGLERQVTTGRTDMDSGNLCPAADSTVISWGTGIEATVGGRTFPQVLVDTMFGLVDIARQTGLEGTRWVIAMPMRMFRPLTYVYACQYWTSLCSGSAGNPTWQDAQQVRALQLEMWNNRYLLIDGNPVSVIFTDGITETRALGNTYTAREVFILPVEWMGLPTLSLQFKKMDNEQAMQFAGFIPGNPYMGVNNGMWLAAKNFQNYCMEILMAGKFRLILDVPFLAARIDTIQYQFQAPYRSAYPDDSIAYVDGGTTRWTGLTKAS